MDYSNLLKHCERLASEAQQNGESPVGAVIVKGNTIVAQGIESTKSKKDVSAHAEMEALRLAHAKLGKDLSDCELITTHEPCVMCSYAIRFHGIKKVVYKNPSTKMGGATSQFNILLTDDVSPHWPEAPEVVRLKIKNQ